jgi:alanine dehydrogenase
MQFLSAEEIRKRATMPRLIESLREAFQSDWLAPARQVVQLPGGTGRRLFLGMSAFDPSSAGAIKLVTYFPDNPANGLPTIQAVVVVFSERGAPQAVLEGTLVTRLRTGAASALASSYLSREDSTHLVVIGTGALVPEMALAHCAARPIRRISICGRRAERAAASVAAVSTLLGGTEVVVAASAEAAVASADIVSCVTSSAEPVLRGDWLRPGTHVDLVGSFTPAAREADDAVMRGARIFVDTLEGALSEAGDLLIPLSRGVIDRGQIEGELADLARGRIRGRTARDEITVFKSVGTAIEDLAAAKMIVAAAGLN